LSLFPLVSAFPLSRAAGQTDLVERDRDLAALIQQVKTGVVAIGTYYFNDKPAVRFSGTGFVTGDGTRIVTSKHVIDGIRENDRLFHLRIFHEHLPDRGVKATILAEDAFHDLSLLQMDENKLQPLTLAKNWTVQEGHAIAFTGYPIGFILGLNPTTHTGIVSAIAPMILPSPSARIIDGEIIRHLKTPFDIYQLDAVAYPGNSGSPVYRITTGEVVGVINMVFVKGKKEHVLKDPTGITYAIPVAHVQALEKTMDEGGSN
jgi:serine protease Do